MGLQYENGYGELGLLLPNLATGASQRDSREAGKNGESSGACVAANFQMSEPYYNDLDSPTLTSHRLIQGDLYA